MFSPLTLSPLSPFEGWLAVKENRRGWQSLQLENKLLVVSENNGSFDCHALMSFVSSLSNLEELTGKNPRPRVIGDGGAPRGYDCFQVLPKPGQ